VKWRLIDEDPDDRDNINPTKINTISGKAWTAETLSAPMARISKTLTWEMEYLAINCLGIRKQEDV
jgi:hypothetical protein